MMHTRSARRGLFSRQFPGALTRKEDSSFFLIFSGQHRTKHRFALLQHNIVLFSSYPVPAQTDTFALAAWEKAKPGKELFEAWNMAGKAKVMWLKSGECVSGQDARQTVPGMHNMKAFILDAKKRQSIWYALTMQPWLSSPIAISPLDLWVQEKEKKRKAVCKRVCNDFETLFDCKLDTTGTGGAPRLLFSSTIHHWCCE